MDYQYNNLNRLTTVNVEGKCFTYEYYADGMVKAVNYPALDNGASIRAEYAYDNVNRLKTVTNKVGSQVISQYSYGYDNNGNITSVVENGQTTSYTYDALNRLKTITRPGGEQITYQYDSRGNRTAGGKSVSGSGGRSYDYDSLDRLSTFTANGETSSYSYDPEGLRTKKVTSAGTVRYHLDNGGRVIAESNADGRVTAQMVWGQQALARKVNGKYYYYIYNGHGDVVKVIDQAGNVVNNYAYDEWGNMLSRQEQLPQPLKYAGEYYVDESGLYYLRARYYDPTIGRFISQDSVEGKITNPLSLNLYTYVENDPLGNIDPSGNITQNQCMYLYNMKFFDSDLGNRDWASDQIRQLSLTEQIKFVWVIRYLTTKQGYVNSLTSDGLISPEVAGMAFDMSAGYIGGSVVGGYAGTVGGVAGRAGNTINVGSSFVRSELPRLEGTIAEAFEGEASTVTLKPGQVFFRAEEAGSTSAGRWLGTEWPFAAQHADELYNISIWGNPMEEVGAYQVTQEVTAYYGKVAGGSGMQIYIPKDIPLDVILKRVGSYPLQ